MALNLVLASDRRAVIALALIAGIVGMVVDAVAAPISYYGGVRLGAVQMPDPIFSLASIAVAWAVVMPVLLRLTERVSSPVVKSV